MSGFFRVGTLSLCLFIATNSERPKFRLDYRYEKAFDSFYKLHHAAATWKDARIRCQAEGAELLVPKSLDEADAVPLMVTQILNRFEGIFVGIHDLYSERSFVNLKGTTMLTGILNILWEYKQPQHSAGRCVAMRRSGRLFVHPCNKTLPYVCKVQTDKLAYNAECDSFNTLWHRGPNNTDICYFMHLEPQNWHMAYATCLSGGGHLAILNNKWEADYIKHIFKQTENRRIPDNDFAYLGFSDLFIRYHFRTIHGQPLDELGYKDWEQTKCKNDNLTADYRCGGIRRTGLLSTWDCEIPAMFFCEKGSKNAVEHSPENAENEITTIEAEANKPTTKPKVETTKAKVETTKAKVEVTKAKVVATTTKKKEVKKARRIDYW